MAAALLLYARPWERFPPQSASDKPATVEAPEPPLTLAVNQLGAVGADVTVNFLQPDAHGQFNRLLGAYGSQPVLHTGDRYRIHIAARREAWLYIVHFDSDGAWRMPLLQDRGDDDRDEEARQHLRAGEEIILPGGFTNGRRHSYRLDPLKNGQGRGTESFHFVLSTRPVEGIQAAYRSALTTDMETSASGRDPIAAARSAVMEAALEDVRSASRMGRPEPDLGVGPDGASAATPVLECQAPRTGCSAQLLILHLPQARP